MAGRPGRQEDQHPLFIDQRRRGREVMEFDQGPELRALKRPSLERARPRPLLAPTTGSSPFLTFPESHSSLLGYSPPPSLFTSLSTSFLPTPSCSVLGLFQLLYFPVFPPKLLASSPSSPALSPSPSKMAEAPRAALSLPIHPESGPSLPWQVGHPFPAES